METLEPCRTAVRTSPRELACTMSDQTFGLFNETLSVILKGIKSWVRSTATADLRRGRFPAKASQRGLATIFGHGESGQRGLEGLNEALIRRQGTRLECFLTFGKIGRAHV